ncbi:MAG: aminopeptidase N [Actinobacteria bacterium]|nr:aminopeptidase N [Actinomycetota bacterium]
MRATRENLTRGEARTRSETITDVRYDVHLRLQADDGFTSRTTIMFAAAGTPTESFIDLTALELVSAELNGTPLDADSFTGTRVALSALRARNRLEIEARHEYSNEGMGLHRFVDPVDERIYLHSQHEPFDAHRTFACFDQPDIKGRFRITVTAPAGWTVISNTPVEHHEDGEDGATWVFAETDVISSYLTAVVAGDYHAVHDRHGDTELALYCRRSLASFLDPDEVFEVTKAGLDFFAETFGRPYAFGKYDQLFVPEFGSGAMENPGCITFNEMHIFRSKVTDASRENRADTILHEMAHMWFGDLVTMRWWADLWLNESFASFMATYAQTSVTRWTDAWVTFGDRWKAWAKHEDQLPTTHPIEPDVPDVESVHQNFDGITYAKGASVLRQLVAWVGEEAFLAGCRSYFDTYAYGNATLRDFLTELEAASGRDLDGWADQWLRRAGLNTLAVELDTDGDRIVGLAIVQSAPDEHPTLRDHRIRVGLYDVVDGRLVLRDRFELDVRGERTEVPEAAGAPVPALVLPNDGDLTYAKLRLHGASLESATEHLHTLSDPLARTLLWGAAWDMVRDGELSAGDYADLVHRNIHGEDKVSVLATLLRRTLTAVKLYGDPEHRPGRLEVMTRHARQALEDAEPGGDEQLVWARHWAETARGEATGDVRRLLRGELPFDGLVLDPELRWHLVKALATAGAADEALVEAERDRDPTDIGERHAAAALASRPDAAAKDAAWKRLVEDEELSHALAFSIARALPQLDQEDVLQPYVGFYFDALDPVWKRRNLDWAIQFSSTTFPHWAAGEPLLERVDQRLAEDELPRPLRRVLLEERDTVLRVMRARARDR